MNGTTTPWGPLGPLPESPVRQLVFVRHGQTTANAGGILQGWIDYPLTELGLAQAQQTADALAEWAIETFYSSPLGRAQLTADILAAPHHKPVHAVPGLVEVHCGGLTGRTWDEFAAIEPEAYARYRAATELTLAKRHELLPGWEPAGHVVYRSWQALGAILATAVGTRILLVSHGDVINAMLTQLLDGDALSGDWRYPQANCAVCVVALEMPKPRLIGGVRTYYQVQVT